MKINRVHREYPYVKGSIDIVIFSEKDIKNINNVALFNQKKWSISLIGLPDKSFKSWIFSLNVLGIVIILSPLDFASSIALEEF